VQGVFLDLWGKERLKELRERKKVRALLSIMAQTRAISHMRQKKERLLRQQELFRINNIKVEPARGLMEQLEEIMEGFSDREKIILKLSIVYEKTHREIAGFMKMPANTVSTIIARKKKPLRKRLKNF